MCSRTCSAILPPMRTRSARPPRCSSTASLSSTLAPPAMSDERPLDLAEQAPEVLELGEQEQPRVRRQQVRDGLGRAVRAVRGAERVVDVEVVSVRELAREARVVLRLARVEAGVLEHASALVVETSSRSRRSTGAIAYVRPVLLRLRPAEMRADADARSAAVEQEAAGSGARPGSACRRRPRRSRAARSGRRGRAPACRRPPPSRRSAAASSSEELAHRGRRAGSCSPTRCRTSRRP